MRMDAHLNELKTPRCPQHSLRYCRTYERHRARNKTKQGERQETEQELLAHVQSTSQHGGRAVKQKETTGNPGQTSSSSSSSSIATTAATAATAAAAAAAAPYLELMEQNLQVGICELRLTQAKLIET